MANKVKSKGIILLVVFISVAVLLPVVVGAESLLDRSKQDGITIGIMVFPPFSYQDSDGKVIGADVDVLRYTLKKMGITKYKFNMMEFGALIPSLKTNRIDVISSNMWIKPERCQQIEFSEPNMAIKLTFLVKKGKSHGVKTWEDIKNKGLSVGLLSGSKTIDFAKSVGIPNSKRMVYPDNVTQLAALKTGRVDIASQQLLFVRKMIKENRMENLEYTGPYTEVAGEIVVNQGAFGFRKSDAEFVKEFNKHMLNFLGSSEWVKMVEPYNISEEDLPTYTKSDLCSK